MLSSFSRLFSATLLKNWGLSKSCGKSFGLTGNCSAAALQHQATSQQLCCSGMLATAGEAQLATPAQCLQDVHESFPCLDRCVLLRAHIENESWHGQP